VLAFQLIAAALYFLRFNREPRAANPTSAVWGVMKIFSILTDCVAWTAATVCGEVTGGFGAPHYHLAWREDRFYQPSPAAASEPAQLI
jgi:hypothetical protein